MECTILSLLVSALAAYFYVRRCSDPAAAWLFPAGVMAVEAAVTAAFWYRAAAGRSSGSMPALLMLLLLLFQQACGASTLRKVWLQQACSLPSFWPTILQIMLPEMFTSKLACPWLEQSGSPGIQAWHSVCARPNALAHAAVAPDPALPAPCTVHAPLHPRPAVLAYITTVATGVWRQPAARGQGPWWRPLLPAVVHAATCAAVVIRFTAAWPVIAIVAIAGLFLGSRGSTNAWQAVRERMPPSIATWGDQHVANGLFAGRLASRIASHCPLVDAAALPLVQQHPDASSLQPATD